MSIYMILQTESVISVSKGGHMGNLNETPSANRLHIGIYGKTNSGKSSLINAVTKQEVSIVADVAGTTTDPVYKPMEIHPLGPCVIIDTAGFDDDSELGERRIEKTHLAAEKTDIAVVVLDIAEVIAAKKAGVPLKRLLRMRQSGACYLQKTYSCCICLKQDRRDFAFRRGTGKEQGKA